jgi:DNA-directed RNA polymerase subunit N
MLIPIRCFTCNTVLADKYIPFVKGKDLSSLGLTKYCCRTIMLTHVNTIDRKITIKDVCASK